MKKSQLVLASALLLAACSSEKAMEETALTYPETRKSDVTDNYFGTVIADPYRWLEDDRSPETAAWVKAQNEVTFGYLKNIEGRDYLEKRLTELWNYERVSPPFKEGSRYFYYKNDGLQNQSVLFSTTNLSDEGQVFLDPNRMSEEGTVALSSFSVSKDGKYAAYGLSSSGSDWLDLLIKDVENGEVLSDTLRWIKFGGAEWYKDGFFYSRYPEPEQGSEYSSQSANQKIFYHKLGTPQSQDVLIYEDPEHPLRYNFSGVTEDERYLVISSSEGTSGNTLAIKDLSMGVDAPAVTVVDDFENDHYAIDHINGKLLIMTNLDAQNYRLVAVDPANPTPENWVDVLPEHEERVLKNVAVAKDRLVTVYMVDATDRIFTYNLNGGGMTEVELPTKGSVASLSADREEQDIYFSFTSFIYPTTVFKHTLGSGEIAIHHQPEIDFNPQDYETKQVFYTSKDGTKIPMFITHKKGLQMDGSNPTMLYGYGGFNISILPSYSTPKTVWLEQGGVYAVANLRGGGEYGEAWHEAGMLDKKQNVFDDFIAAAEYLISEQYTSPEKLAISGRSNGGLLVGAAMTQRPEMFGVALPGVGVMDMLRFHKFTVGHGWVVEYGSSDNEADFQNLYSYSPLHNIKEGVEYPATLVTTADHDDRVVPAHSFKFIAELQSKYKGENPVMIRIDTKAGHGSGKPTAMIIEEEADVMAFTLKNLGVEIKEAAE